MRPAQRSVSTSWSARLAALGGFLAILLVSQLAWAQEPPECLLQDPTQWPAPSRPYFMLVVDTSASMNSCTNPVNLFPDSCPSYAPLNSCGFEPTRLNDAKCALSQTVLAFSGLVNFGLATFPVILSGCSSGMCADSCTAPDGTCSPPLALSSLGEFYQGSGCSVSAFQNWVDHETCGNEPDCDGQPTPSYPPAPPWPQNWENSANIVVDMLQDPTWGASPPASNVTELLKWFDGQCDESKELFALGATPLAGALRTIHQYYAYGWSSGWNDSNYCASAAPGDLDHPTPIDDAQDRPCRSLNVILVTDGDHSSVCGDDPISAAATLFNTGVYIDGAQVPIRTHVIAFAGVDPSGPVADIADAGDDGLSNNTISTALYADDEVGLAQALAEIVAGVMEPEVCNNVDDNCNGCTDEGYVHYCNTGQTCCGWATPAEREACLVSYRGSVAGSPPDGDLTLLPCTTPIQATQPANWLCYDPHDICDEVDNNCDGTIDEEQVKCGNPPACPSLEICDGQDNDCDGFVDEQGVCGSCTNPSPEVCDGCDNDCDGFADEWDSPTTPLPDIPCGLPAPANCAGTRACMTPPGDPSLGFPVPPGTCLPTGGGYGPCSNDPQPEVCDGVDNNCNITIDDGIASTACKPVANPNGLYYSGAACGAPLPAGVAGCDADSQCTLGGTACVGGTTVCQGGTGPSVEICDGIDNDCDGVVDDNVFGEGMACGNNTPPCTPGVTVCVNGAMVCQGGSQPQPEVCDGVDNDCNGVPDDGAMADAPASLGCWDEPGTCCSVAGLQWCPPPGANCQDLGSLVGAPASPTSPCHLGSLSCVAGAWVCQGANGPSGPEVCDGVDSDCSGVVDDNVAEVGAPCGTDVGECEEGQLDCVTGPDASCGLAAGQTALCCVGGVGPVTPELCDNLDNDCDGIIDNNVGIEGQPCTAPGVCNGTWTCDGAGGQLCVGDVPTPGRCDGLDNDCDGAVDEPDELAQDPAYATVCGTSIGECATGTSECVSGGWVCLGDLGPSGEVCDGLDNDCDDAVDNGALCPAVGGLDYHCYDGACRPACEPSSPFPCPAGMGCVEQTVDGELVWLCLAGAGDCGGVTCPDGWSCVGQQCVDLCDPDPCQPWESCVQGTCTDTTCTGLGASCPAGWYCVDHACVPDPCGEAGCDPATEFCARDCDDESCLASCTPLCDCPPGQRCVQAGVCEADPCDEVECDVGQRCHPETGVCEDDPCQGVVCDASERCFEGGCVTDPCLAVVCPELYVCVVRSTTDASGEAVPDPQCQADDAYWVPGEGGSGSADDAGCGCRTTAPGDGALPLLVSMLIWGLRRRRRRRRAVPRDQGPRGAPRCPPPGALLLALAIGTAGIGCGDDSTGDGNEGHWERPDASTADARIWDAAVIPDACIPSAEVCDGVDNDCDDQVDEGFDLQNDPNNCGACGEACDFDNAFGRCVSASCVLEGCFPGFWDNNGDPDDGCEYACFETNGGVEACDALDNDCDGVVDEDFDLQTDPANCGECGVVCTVPFATAGCAAGACVVASCDPGRWDANGDPNDGCELACQQTNGGVEICDGLDNDCNGAIDDGLGGDPAIGQTCFGDPDGLCADPAHAGQTTCVDGVVVCSGPNVLRQYDLPEVCDGVDEDCDGVIDNNLTDQTGSPCAQQGATNVWPCQMGVWQCQNGGYLVCVGEIPPGTETCNGIDDDCDGQVDLAGGNPPSDAGGSCWPFGPGSTPPAPPAGITSPCSAGSTVCLAGALVCQGYTGPTASTDRCGEDSNCDGVYDGLFDTNTDVQNCGSCGFDCNGGPDGDLSTTADNSLNATWSCQNGTCQFGGCHTNFWDLDGDESCEYPCFYSGAEVCNGVDDDCDGLVDSADPDLIAPGPTVVCGVSPSASAPECTTDVAVTCQSGSWSCTFPPNVCDPSCASAVELCDALDNNCDGNVNESFPSFGQPCHSDDGLPYPGHGACRGEGTFQCDTPTSTACNAVKQTCANPPSNPTQTCDEVCDGIDNDCDGLVDEPFSNPGVDDPTTAWDESAFYVAPAVTQVAGDRWITTYEISRPDASPTSAGSGNGYFCAGGGCPGGIPPAPAGVPLDETPGCSLPGRLPWFNVTPIEAEQVCYDRGGFLCELADWQTACAVSTTSPCDWGYGPFASCNTPANGSSVFCNLGDFDPDPDPGDQDGLLVTASPALAGCAADWSGQPYTNSEPDIFDITGNLREITKAGANVYPLMGGSYHSPEGGATCDFDFFVVQQEYQSLDTGFRCCFDTDPR